MGKLSTREALTILLAKVEATVIELDRTRTQTAFESYCSAKELLLDAIETVVAGEVIAA